MPNESVESVYTPDPGAMFHLVGRNIAIPPAGELTIHRVPDATKEVTFKVDLLGDVLRPTAVTVRSRIGDEITATDLRAVNVQTLWRAAIIQHVKYIPGPSEPPRGGRPVQLSDAELERLRLRGPERETLEYVADVYSLARSLGLAPALYVQEIFAGESMKPLPRTTATKWIKRARDLGLISESGILADSLLDETDRSMLRAFGYGGDDGDN